jgi:hypothetical protein
MQAIIAKHTIILIFNLILTTPPSNFFDLAQA